MNNPTVIIFSGKTGSGKSSVSDALSELINWPKVSFGDYVRQVAVASKVDQSRQNLQDLGQRLVDLNPVLFCNLVLSQIEYSEISFIVDGLRHRIVLDILKDILNNHVLVHIHLTISELERSVRTATEIENLKVIDSHRSELEVIDTIKSAADLVIDTTDKPPKEVADSIVYWLKKGYYII